MRYTRDYLRQFSYDGSVSPQWIGESDRFWYRFRDSRGTRYMFVDPAVPGETSPERGSIWPPA